METISTFEEQARFEEQLGPLESFYSEPNKDCENLRLTQYILATKTSTIFFMKAPHFVFC